MDITTGLLIIFIVVLIADVLMTAWHIITMRAAWIAIRSLEAHNRMMFDFLEAERAKTTSIAPN